VDLWKKPYHFWMDRTLAGISRKVICVSRKVEEFYLRKVPELRSKTVVIYNGIDAEFFKPAGKRDQARERLGVPGERFLAGTIGRLVPQKRQQDLLLAIERLKKAGRNVGGVLIGEGPERSKLEEKVRALGLEKEIIFTGFCDDTPALYSGLDAFVLCSEREGFPMTLLEAMAAGVPVVATDVGGVSECVEHEKTGLLIPAGEPEAIADALLRLAEDLSLRDRLVKNAGERVRQEFSIARMARRHEEVYEQGLRSKK
jgi:glycosyltransferase involved in cell wall biosynthesis